MIPTVLFWVGIGAMGIVGVGSYFHAGDDKRGVVALPFALLAAAAVAHFIGM